MSESRNVLMDRYDVKHEANHAGSKRSGAWTDARTEAIIGTLLRAGVILSASVVFIGGILFLIRYGSTRPHYGVFQGEPDDLRSLFGIIHSATALHGRGIIQLGLLVLIATPVARVVFSVVAFALERDRLYVVVTLIVLGVLTFSLAGGHL
jgi:uncharacterized membrane protein